MELPTPAHIIPTLTYLYTGDLPPGASDAEVVFGMLANAAFLLSERLTRDCLGLIEEKLKAPESFASFICHDSFGVELVPVDVVRPAVEGKTGYEVVHMVINWVGNHPSFNDDGHGGGIKEMVDLARRHAITLSVEDMKRLDEATPPSGAKCTILMDPLLAKLDISVAAAALNKKELERVQANAQKTQDSLLKQLEQSKATLQQELQQTRATLQQERQTKRCTQCDHMIAYITRNEHCWADHNYGSLCHSFQGGWE